MRVAMAVELACTEVQSAMKEALTARGRRRRGRRRPPGVAAAALQGVSTGAAHAIEEEPPLRARSAQAAGRLACIQHSRGRKPT